ncbi:hypothetical protein [Caballeronia sp. S22]|uniref:hypothetical protein n=1 Tax=Caballeronia sp. S22 TaxID=3137182 RepID=UPI003530BA9B
MTTIDTHRWDSRLQYQDVQTVLHRPRVRAFLNDVVKPALAAIDADIERPRPIPSFEQAVLPRELLDRFAAAIVGFWEDVEYIRLNSIERKDEQIHAEMERLIQNRKSRV